LPIDGDEVAWAQDGTVDEAHPPVADNRASGDENGEYGPELVDRFGPIETFRLDKHWKEPLVGRGCCDREGKMVHFRPWKTAEPIRPAFCCNS
jgi:hypothetical protein